ncbi:MAG TPA: DUF6084 family protein [Kofleriaceae bacterium]|jgi:hypothetical protein
MRPPELAFAIIGAVAVPHAAAPLVALRLRVSATGPVGGAFLRCQVEIDAARRRYDEAERERLGDLFGGPSVWERGLKSLHWGRVTVLVPAFEESAVVDLELPCTQDLCVAAARYVAGLSGGTMPIRIFFGGTVFASDAEGRAQVLPIPMSREASFDLPVAVWRELLSEHFPGSAFVPLRRDLLDRLDRARLARGLTSLDQLVEQLLEEPA